MVDVTLRPVDGRLLEAVLALRTTAEQEPFIATNARSMAQARTDDALTPYAVFDGTLRGIEHPADAPLGFAVTEVRAGVGFILRMMVDASHQGRGYGRALLDDLTRRLERHVEVEMVATSHRRANTAMAATCRSAGFVLWQPPWEQTDPDEVYLRR